MIDFSKIIVENTIKPYLKNLENQIPIILKEKLPEFLNNIGETSSDLISQKIDKKFSQIKVTKTEVKNNIFIATIESKNDPKIIAHIREILKLQQLNRYILEKASMEERKENKK